MKIRTLRNIKSAIVATVFFAAIIGLRAGTLTVTNTNDSGPGSLRQALVDANDGDTIDFAVTGTIGLTTGELSVDKSITISGPGADNLAVNGNGTSRVFHVAPDRNVTISYLTITNGGSFPNNGSGIYNERAGLTVSSCTVSNNSAGLGGGIFNDGSSGYASLQVVNSTISDNSALLGAGICNVAADSSATVVIRNSSLSGNAAGIGIGGGVSNQGANASMQISNSTFSGNSAFAGGTIHNTGNAIIDLSHNILKAGKTGGNIVNQSGSTVTSHGYNLSSDDAGGYLTSPGDQINTDPLLGPLQDNGGPTFTHELFPGSPAIDAGDPSFTPPPFYDQRGPNFYRVRNGRIDIGSFEVQAGTLPPRATPRPRPTPHPRPTPSLP
jgi:hypothetical protein